MYINLPALPLPTCFKNAYALWERLCLGLPLPSALSVKFAEAFNALHSYIGTFDACDHARRSALPPLLCPLVVCWLSFTVFLIYHPLFAHPLSGETPSRHLFDQPPAGVCRGLIGPKKPLSPHEVSPTPSVA